MNNIRFEARRRGPRRRTLSMVWVASGVAALVMVLGVNGTLGAWTAAIITNDTNTVATAKAVILKEVGLNGASPRTSQTCYSSDGAGSSNTYTCQSINKYGGVTSPLSPGSTQTTDVTFTNVGSGNGASFKLDAGACTQTPAATAQVGNAPAVNNLCTAAGELTVAITCNDGATIGANPAWTDLTYAAGSPSGIGTRPLHSVPASLTAGATWTCRFTVSLSNTANPTDQNIVVSQPLTWTLTQV